MQGKITAEKTASMTDVELYRIIYENRFGPSSKPPSVSEMVRTSRAWVQTKAANTANAICENETVKRLAREELKTQDIILLITTIAAILSEGTPGSESVVAAALIVRLGLQQLCKAQWAQEQADE